VRRNTLIESGIALAMLFLVSSLVQAQMPAGPYTTGCVSVTITNSNTDRELVTDIHYPASGASVDPSGARGWERAPTLRRGWRSACRRVSPAFARDSSNGHN
jgi:hypothetical protein